MLFKNNAAKKAYLSWIGVKVESGSILELARLDAWISTWLEITRDRIRDGGARSNGGHRNKLFNELFDKYLPHTIEQILRKCRTHLELLRPSELRKPFVLEEQQLEREEVQERSRKTAEGEMRQDFLELDCERGDPGDIFDREGRVCTTAFLPPKNNFDYVALTRTFFTQHICS